MNGVAPDLKKEIPEMALKNVLNRILSNRDRLVESILTEWKAECEKLRKERGGIILKQ